MLLGNAKVRSSEVLERDDMRTECGETEACYASQRAMAGGMPGADRSYDRPRKAHQDSHA